MYNENDPIYYYFVQFSKYSDYFLFFPEEYEDLKPVKKVDPSSDDYRVVLWLEREFSCSIASLYEVFENITRNCNFHAFKCIKKYFAPTPKKLGSFVEVKKYLDVTSKFVSDDLIKFGLLKPETKFPGFWGFFEYCPADDTINYIQPELLSLEKVDVNTPETLKNASKLNDFVEKCRKS